MTRAPDWYPGWRDEAFVQLQAKTAHMLGTYGIGGTDRYDYDLETGLLLFSDRGVRQVVAQAVVVGSVSQLDRNWLWGWANESVPPAAAGDLDRVRSFGLEHGIEELTTDYLEAEDLNALGWALTAVAARILDAEGAYRSPDQRDAEVFLAYHDVRRVT